MNAVSNITPQQLTALTPGSTFETEGLFPGMSAAPLVWTNTSHNKNSGQYMFNLTYFGVSLGQMALFVHGDKVDAEPL